MSPGGVKANDKDSDVNRSPKDQVGAVEEETTVDHQDVQSVAKEIEETIKLGNEVGVNFDNVVDMVRQTIEEWIRKMKVKLGIHFISLQETQFTNGDDVPFVNIWGNYDYDSCVVPSVGRSGGLACCWDPSMFNKHQVIYSKHFIVISGNWQGLEGKINLVNVYAPQGDIDKRHLWMDLLCILNTNEGCWVLMGDFNAIRQASDRSSGAPIDRAAMEFNEFILEAGLSEINMCGGRFTWMKDDGSSSSKIDRFLLCQSMILRWPMAMVKVLDRRWSDHRPIVLLSTNNDYGPAPFRFYNSWLANRELNDIVITSWNGSYFDSSGAADYLLLQKLRRLKEEIKKRAKNNRLKDTVEATTLELSVKAIEAKAETSWCDYKIFKSCNPPSFDGKKDAVTAHQWLREMESVIKISECNDSQKVKFAAHSFVSEALFWWDTIQQAMGEPAVEALSWESFKRLVLAKFCPKFVIDKMEKDFMNLEVGTMTHQEYTTKFNEMSRLVPHLVTPEESRIKRYIQGFPSEVRRLVKGSAPGTYQSAVELTAELFEEVYGLGGRPMTSKRKWGDYSQGSKKDNFNPKRKISGSSPTVCKICNRMHSGNCRMGMNVCFKMANRENALDENIDRDTDIPIIRRESIRLNPNLEDEVHIETSENSHENDGGDDQQDQMEANFVRMLKAAIPEIAAEIRRQEKDSNGNHSGADNNTGIETGAAMGNGATQIIVPLTTVRQEDKKKGCDYKIFKSCNPPSFDGKKDAVTAHQWLREMESVIKISECNDSQKVKFAAHSFVSEALFWWDTIQQAMGEPAVEALSWESFKRLVLAKFCPKFVIDKMEKDFMNLEVGTMTHQEYTTKFNEMSRLVPHLVTPEESRIKRYIQGFPSEVRRLVKGSAPGTYQSAVELTAELFEEVYGLGGRPMTSKRKWGDYSQGSKKDNFNPKRKISGSSPTVCGLGVCRLESLNKALIIKWWWRALNGDNGLWSATIKAIHNVSFGEIGNLGKTSLGGIWASIIKTGKSLNEDGRRISSVIRRQVGDGSNTLFWKHAWMFKKSKTCYLAISLKMEVILGLGMEMPRINSLPDRVETRLMNFMWKTRTGNTFCSGVELPRKYGGEFHGGQALTLYSKHIMFIKGRNNWCFHRIRKSIDCLVEDVKLQAFTWAEQRGNKISTDWEKWVVNPWEGISKSGFSARNTAEDVTKEVDGHGLTAIITGPTSGIGLETARVLALRGVHVVMAARNVEAAAKCKDTIIKGCASATIDVMELDVSSLESVTRFADEYISMGLPLNILICNAGVMFPPFSLSKDGIESQFATNYLGHFHLTNLLLDTMKTTARKCGKEGRIVLVSSEAHRLTYKGGIMFDKLNDEKCYNKYYAYGQSKLANILHAKELTRRLKEEGVEITVNSLHPGVIATNLARHSSFMSVCIYGLFKHFQKNIPQGASTTCYVALNPKVKGVSGEYFADNNVAKPASKAKDAELAKKLWECGLELTTKPK
ncbi:hypothetical protein E3N88_26968 [Mikania micrantha]|uniref:Retrotransposon gag domain-containing protein n=1 Tax=Mikania micrantha TaxID=192012 RepID=A0A5N6MWD3_9ASTR|nr:hypothetical protein E3N88_26968 [Mikania micrantha]